MTMPENRAEDPVAKRALIEQILKRKKALAAEPLDVQQRPEAIPMSFAQERLWYVEQLGASGSAYNISGGMRFEGKLDIDVLSAALSAIVERHEALRTRFPAFEDHGVQVIDAPEAVVLSPVSVGEAEVRTALTEVASRPFDLARDRLYRFALFQVSSDVHVLGVVMNHIVSDGWSVGVLVRELSALYNAFRAGRPSPLAPLPLQYADYAIWQRRVIAANGFNRDLAYWRQKLTDVPPHLALPTDRPRPAVQTSRGSRIGLSVPSHLVSRLTELAHREGATLYMVLTSALQIVLGRWSGQRDIVVGSTIAGRNHAKVEPLIGFFLNTVALRTDLSGNPSFKDLLARVRETTLDAYAHQSAPFERVIAEIQPPRDPSRHPLFQVMFVLRNLPETKVSLDGLRVQSVGDNRATTKMDLSLNLRQTGASLRGEMEYATDLFDESTVRRLIQHWLTLLEHAVVDENCRIDDLTMIPTEERELIADWSGATPSYPSEAASLHELVESWALRTPDAIAVIADGRELGYRQLNWRANAVAAALVAGGVKPETVVGVRIDRSCELLIGVLAVLKAGGVYLPLDPALPNERASYMLNEANARFLLTSRNTAGAAIDGGRPTWFVDSDAVLSDETAYWRGPDIAPDNAAYIIFTSGSTGKPKGVMATHRGIVNYLNFLRAHYGMTPADRVLNVSSMGYDPSMRDFFGPLSSGAAAVLVAGNGALDATRYWRAVREHHVTRLLSITPSFLRLLCDAAEREPGQHALSDVLTCGEALDASIVRRARSALGEGVQIVNQYGPSECSMASTSHVAGNELDTIVAIGRPLPGVEAYVLDERLQPAPIGVKGELYIGGAGVTRGYIGRPDMTADRFLPNPFKSGERLYRTGDYVRWDAHGELHYIGRIDSQVKLRGTRIEPNEIVAVLNALPDVAQSAVVVSGQGEAQQLVAYVVPARDGLMADSLVKQLKTRLPDALIPNAFVLLETLPLTANGKLDRNALPEHQAHLLRGEFVAPESSTERIISSIFTAILKLDRVGRDDSFFMLGGHSLLAIRVVARIEDVFGVRPSLRTLFERPTVAALAVEVDALAAGDVECQSAQAVQSHELAG